MKGKSFYTWENFLYQALEYKFQVLKHKFQVLEHKFQALEQKISLGGKTFSMRKKKKISQEYTLFPLSLIVYDFGAYMIEHSKYDK